jgi:hypothetical protein
MKLKTAALTEAQWKHLKEHGWVQAPLQFRPADNAKAARQRRNGRKAVANPVARNKFGGR